MGSLGGWGVRGGVAWCGSVARRGGWGSSGEAWLDGGRRAGREGGARRAGGWRNGRRGRGETQRTRRGHSRGSRAFTPTSGRAVHTWVRHLALALGVEIGLSFRGEGNERITCNFVEASLNFPWRCVGAVLELVRSSLGALSELSRSSSEADVAALLGRAEFRTSAELRVCGPTGRA